MDCLHFEMTMKIGPESNVLKTMNMLPHFNLFYFIVQTWSNVILAFSQSTETQTATLLFSYNAVGFAMYQYIL